MRGLIVILTRSSYSKSLSLQPFVLEDRSKDADAPVISWLFRYEMMFAKGLCQAFPPPSFFTAHPGSNDLLEILERCKPFVVQVGQTTDFIDKKVHEMIIDNNAYPSPLTYGRPHSGGLDSPTWMKDLHEVRVESSTLSACLTGHDQRVLHECNKACTHGVTLLDWSSSKIFILGNESQAKGQRDVQALSSLMVAFFKLFL